MLAEGKGNKRKMKESFPDGNGVEGSMVKYSGNGYGNYEGIV